VIMRASYRAFAEIRARGLTVGFRISARAGIAGCSSEIVGSGGFGAIVDLDRCPPRKPNTAARGDRRRRDAGALDGGSSRREFTPVLLAIYNEEFSLPQIARGACAAVIGTVTAERDLRCCASAAKKCCASRSIFSWPDPLRPPVRDRGAASGCRGCSAGA